MKRIKLGRPSPALVIACISLFVALSGVGYAAATIGSKQIKNNSVASGDIKNSSIVGKDVKTSGLTGSDVKANSLTGSDIAESKLGKVPSAGSADSANSANTANTANTAGSAGSAGSVGGLTLRKINYEANSVSPERTILSAGGLVLSAACAASNTLSVTARTTSNDASIYATSAELDNSNNGDGASADDLEGGAFDIGDTFNANVDGDFNPNLVTLSYSTRNGTQVTAIFSVDRAGTAAGCEVHGSAIAG